MGRISSSQHASRRSRRGLLFSLAPWLLTALTLLVGGGNLIRGVLALRTAPLHGLWPWSIDPVVLGLVYIGWGVVFLGVGVGFFGHRSNQARWANRVGAFAYQTTVWVIHFIGDRSSQARRLWPRDLVLTVLFLSVVLLLTDLNGGGQDGT